MLIPKIIAFTASGLWALAGINVLLGSRDLMGFCIVLGMLGRVFVTIGALVGTVPRAKQPASTLEGDLSDR
ncbi:hypothetical protein DES53_102413 [Roseimicrobium gellanilyticum]|uniref:Uncharacterized protein n=2 Tax=Roseimicrobium gellanilyticum TaxID=748857 RepID=A0A366HTK3_9BACT|nr:hypothetical protein DES53_102413 [Roseimicrobium gellanilyticum]